MLQPLRSRGFALATLAAFLLAQPAALCTALCLFQRHHAPAHAMPQMARGGPAMATSACHPTTAGDIQQDRFNVLSPMAPTRGPVIAVAPPGPVEAARMRPASPREVFHTVESPPPRFA
jgi:hypothetical protein